MSSHDLLDRFLTRAKPQHAAAVNHIFLMFSPNDSEHQWSTYMKFINLQAMYDLEENVILALITVFPDVNEYQFFDTVLDYQALKPHVRDRDPWEICIYLRERQHMPSILAKETGLAEDLVRDALRRHPTYTLKGHRTTLYDLKFQKLIENNCPEDLASKHATSAETIDQIMQRVALSRPRADVVPAQVAAVRRARPDRDTCTQRFVRAIKEIPTNGQMELCVRLLTAITNPVPELRQHVSFFENSLHGYRETIPFYDDLFLLRQKSEHFAAQLAHALHGFVTPDISKLSYMREVLNVCHAVTRQEWSHVELEVEVQNALEQAGGVDEASISMYIQSWTEAEYQLDVHAHILKFHHSAQV